ncbi:MAG: histidine kinase [Cytophagaceae bacterium]|jgi:CheY-like chemotaxis protein|nr:histidine kinase [Cytophagaceae bacterium]
MNKNGPVVILEDDEDDQQLFIEIFNNLKYENEIIFFKDGNEALEYLNRIEITPFLILSDINLHKVDGLALRDKIQTSHLLHLKCTPYLFFTTTIPKTYVIEAYSTSVQGFFQKPNSYAHLESTIKKIVEYWKECFVPDEC